MGFLGPGPVSAQLDRSLAFAHALQDPEGLAVDLGTGGGTPGLVLAVTWPGSQWLFIESNQRRSTWLREAVDRLALSARVTVHHGRAEEVGRGPVRGTAQLVTARSFAPPGPTAECAAPLLRVGGVLAVADPPQEDHAPTARWPADGLSLLNLVLRDQVVQASGGGPVTIALIESAGACSDRFPRRTGMPAKRPLF